MIRTFSWTVPAHWEAADLPARLIAQKFGGLYTQNGRQLGNGGDTGAVNATLQSADISSINASLIREGFLRQPLRLA